MNRLKKHLLKKAQEGDNTKNPDQINAEVESGYQRITNAINGPSPINRQAQEQESLSEQMNILRVALDQLDPTSPESDRIEAKLISLNRELEELRRIEEAQKDSILSRK